jgi:hypothetical protein
MLGNRVGEARNVGIERWTLENSNRQSRAQLHLEDENQVVHEEVVCGFAVANNPS